MKIIAIPFRFMVYMAAKMSFAKSRLCFHLFALFVISIAAPCEEGHFDCKNGACIKDDLLCNSMDNCGNGADESLDLCPPEEESE